MTVALLRVTMGFVVAIIAFAIATAIAPSSASASSLYNCTVDGMKPLPVTTISGAKYSAGWSRVVCPSTQRYVTVEVQLWGDDPGTADNYLGSTTKRAYVGPRGESYFASANFRCNEDVDGSDELYTKTRIKIGSSYSAWDRGYFYTFSC